MEDSFTENAVRKRLVLILTEEKSKGWFLKIAKEHKVPRRARNDVKKLLEEFLKKLINFEKSYTIKRLSQNVQDFYVTISQRFEICSVYKGINSNTRYKILEVVERYLTERLNKTLFGLIAVQSKEEDASIQRIIDNHYWITPNHLEARINLECIQVREQLELAISDLSDMNFKESTLDKLTCIVQCSNRINMMFKLCNKRRSSADDYLPILHYVVLKANPPLLRSNITFVHLFGLPERLQTEEQGYYFISLCGVAEAIESMSSDNLNISNEEYDRMLSVDATRVIPIVQLLYSNINEVARLGFGQENIAKESKRVPEGLRKFKESFKNQVLFFFREVDQCGVKNDFSLVEELKIVEGADEIEAATEVDESYVPQFSIDDILQEYVIISDSYISQFSLKDILKEYVIISDSYVPQFSLKDILKEYVIISDSYVPQFSVNDILQEYVIIPDSAVTTVTPYC